MSEVKPRVPEAFTGLNRIPILMLGPLLHRAGEAFVPLVGGDPIGRRPVDFHVEALTALGAEIEHGPTGITAKATRLRGARITLPYPSVGATETVLLSAVLADGKTVLRNAATEPEVVELALFLQRMGANIELSPDRRIVIEGVEQLKGASTRLAGDRLEAFSYLVAGLITRGEVRVHGCPRTAWSPRSPRSRGWAPSSTSPTSGSPRRPRTGCVPRPSTPTPTPAS